MISVPFPGNKRYAYRMVRGIFLEGKYQRVHEPFGGSAVLSANLVADGLVGADSAFINDYDRFWDLYPDYLDAKDRIVAACLEGGVEKRSKNGPKGYYYRIRGDRKIIIKNLALDPRERDTLRAAVLKEPRELWRHLHIGNNFTFPRWDGRTIKIDHFKYFQNELSTKKQRAFFGVIEGCQRVSLDWRDYFGHHKDRLREGALVVMDPPYPTTEQGIYMGKFTVDDTVEALRAFCSTGADVLFFNAPEVMERILSAAGADSAYRRCGNHAMTMTKTRYDAVALIKG